MHAATSPLVGRDAELQVLRTLLPKVRDDQAQVVALSGTAGVGKSRLAEECLALARGAGLLPLRGAGGALQQDLPYAPLVEALRPLVREGSGPGRSALVEGLPDLGRLFGDLSLPAGPELGDPGLERTRMFESVCRLLERASARQPLALLLDDVHWADRGSLALLHYLVRGLAGRPLLVVLTYRADETYPALDELLAGLRRAELFTEVRLAGLGDEAVGMLAGNLLNGEAPAGLLEVLTARSGGLPLFVGALVGSFVDSGALHRYDGRWALAPQQPDSVPAAVSALLRSRVEKLPEDGREVLDLLAVCGAQADHALLERLMPGERLLGGLAHLRDKGIVVEEVTDGRVRYRAAHPLLCEVAYDLLPLVARRRRHAEVARTVRKHTPDQRGVLAQHVRRAGDEIEPGYALDVLVGAADEALAHKAGDEALANVRAALELAESLGRAEVAPALHDQLAQAYELAGDPEQAGSAWVAAAGGRAGIERAERLNRAATIELEAGRHAECHRHLGDAAAELADVESSAVHASLALTRGHLAMRSGDASEMAATIAELVRLGELPGSTRARVGVPSGRCHAAFIAGRYAEGRTHLAALLRLMDGRNEEIEDYDRERANAGRLGCFLELAWGDLPAARSMAEGALALAGRTGVPSLEIRPREILGLVAFVSGEWDEALTRCREVVDIAQRVGLPRGVALATATTGLVRVRQGRLDDAMACATRGRRAMGSASSTDRHVFGPIEAVEAAAALARGDAATAGADAADSLRRYTPFRGLALTTLAEAQLVLGDLAGAAAAARTLSALGPGAPYPGALAAWVQGRVDRDELLLRRAADELAALGFRYEASVARLDLAEQAAGQVDELGECLRVLERLGAQPQVDRARRLMRRAGQRAPVPARQRRADGLSPREEQVARLVAGGLSNPEIAQRLYLSTRTVTTHLQNMYGRLGLTSRTGLTRYVVEELPPDTHLETPNT